MAAASSPQAAGRPHVPVLIGPLLEAVAPVGGVWIDGTFGAGGYTRGPARGGRGPRRRHRPRSHAHRHGARLGRTLRGSHDAFEGNFARLDTRGRAAGRCRARSRRLVHATRRGGPRFLVHADGPARHAHGREGGPSAADLVNEARPRAGSPTSCIHYGEERAARRIARAHRRGRATAPIETTLRWPNRRRCLPRPSPASPIRATRSFQALRIAVNDEYGELIRGVDGGGAGAAPGGHAGGGHLPLGRGPDGQAFLAAAWRPGRACATATRPEPTGARGRRFEIATRKAVAARRGGDRPPIPRARSAKLRVARRTVDRPPRRGVGRSDRHARYPTGKADGDAPAAPRADGARRDRPPASGPTTRTTHAGGAGSGGGSAPRHRCGTRAAGDPERRMGLSEPSRPAARPRRSEFRPLGLLPLASRPVRNAWSR